VGSNLVSFKIQDGYGVKAMPGSIPAPDYDSIENKKNEYISIASFVLV